MEDSLSIPSFARFQNSEEGLQDDCFSSRVLVISEEQYLHVSGNSIRLASLPKNESNLGTKFSSNSDYTGAVEEACEDIVFATADKRRGFSCMAFNSFKGRVAYSPRHTSPSIFVKSVNGRRTLCEIKDGVSIEYQDLCFDKKGTRLAAIGRGRIDAKLYVWDLMANDNFITPVLILTYSFHQSLATCLFDPMNRNSIAILTNDAKTAIRCYLSPFVEKYKVSKILRHSPSDELRTDTRITSLGWETKGRLMLGLGDGSIMVYQDDIITESYLVKHSGTRTEAGAIKGVIVCSKFLIVGHENGQIFWFRRNEDLQPITLSDEMYAADVSVDLSSMIISPNFDTLVVQSFKAGMLYSLCTCDKDENAKEGRIKTVCYQFPTGIVTCMACVVITGKAAYSVLVTGSSDGTIKVWEDSDRKGRVNGALEMIGFMDLGVPITSLKSLTGYPVIAAGCIDSSIKFIHITKKKNASHEKIEVDLTELKSEVLNVSAITHLAFNEKTNKLAAGCFDSGEVFIICTQPANLHVIGVLETLNKEKLESIFWSRTNPTYICVGTGSSETSLLYYDTTPLCFTPEPLKPLRHLSGLSSIAKGFVPLTSSTSHKEDASQLLFCTTASTRTIEFCHFEESDEGVKVTPNPISKCNESICGCTTIMGIDNRVLIGTLMGGIEIIKINAEGFDSQIISNTHCQPIVAMCMSSDMSRMYSSSLDGSLLVHRGLESRKQVTRSSYDYDYLVRCDTLSLYSEIALTLFSNRS